MTFKDVKLFMLRVIEELEANLPAGQRKTTKHETSDELNATKIAKLLQKLGGSESSTTPMILVIDEVDQFSSHEKSFVMLVQAILQDSYKTNTSIIGIANSVDLPFKRKHSAIAMF